MHIGTRPEDLCWMSCGLRALRRHCITHRHDYVIDITKWAQECFQKPLSENTILPRHLQMPTKALSCKKEAIDKHGPEALSCPVDLRLVWNRMFQLESVLWSDESKFYIYIYSFNIHFYPRATYILVENHGRRVLKRRETFQYVISVQFKSQHLWWYGGA